MHALRADGSEFPIEMVLWRTNVGGTGYYTASLVDLTERHSASQQIERQRDALRQSEKLSAMGSLLAGVAHELNNPLAIVMGRASLLEEKCDDPALLSDVQRIREAAERCGRIVRTFLNMARSKPATRESLSLNDVTRAAAEMLSYSYRSHGVKMRLELVDDLPSVKADGDQVGQIVLNLLVNAQQALGATEGERYVLIETGVEARRENREPRVWLRVSDNGPGVPPELRDKLFEPFFTTKPEGIGTGLGLAMSRSMARDHGGDLTLEPTSHQGGASFRLNLPISGEPVQESIPAVLHGPDTTVETRVLVVDDEPEIIELVRDILEGAGYEVATAESGAVALALLETARFDAVVSDLRMPDMDGATFWREIEQRYPRLARRVLFVTGDTLSPGAREFLRQAHCNGLDKPFSKGDLLAAVARLLD
jgi:signal transduction histidine kinase/CheY-like chemotaxis protein